MEQKNKFQALIQAIAEGLGMDPAAIEHLAQGGKLPTQGQPRPAGQHGANQGVQVING